MSINKRKTNKPAKAKVKAKSPSISQLKKKLWGIFSQYIRIKDTDLSGMGKCCTCNIVIPWSHPKGISQCGHFLPKKGFPNLYFEENNTGLQCAACNGFLEGQQYFYSLYITKRYGKQELDRLIKEATDYRSKNKLYRWDKNTLLSKIEYYSNELKKEKLKRNIK
jgi:hypothetical protein